MALAWKMLFLQCDKHVSNPFNQITDNMNMKRTFFLVLVIVTFLIGGCQKQESTIGSIDRVIAEETEGKTAPHHWLVFFAGHDGSKCNGCTMIAGKLIHRDCQGHGRECSKVARVTIDQIGSDITATTVDTFDLTSEDFFLMPDRSLYFYTDENNNRVFLNIPEQTVYRDAVTRQFTFTGLFFSERAAFSNN